MSTLLLRLCGPMQSWGVESRFEQRSAGSEPSKSGVVGLLGAALGRDRSADFQDVAALRMGVRVLREGVVQADFQTAGASCYAASTYGVARFDGSTPKGVVLTRYYLADADFLVGLETDDAQTSWLYALEAALRQPHWPLSLGRKAYVPSVPVALPESGVRAVSLRDALLDFPWSMGVTTARCVYEEVTGPEERHDQPVSLTWGQARYVGRGVRVVMEQREGVA